MAERHLNLRSTVCWLQVANAKKAKISEKTHLAKKENAKRSQALVFEIVSGHTCVDFFGATVRKERVCFPLPVLVGSRPVGRVGFIDPGRGRGETFGSLHQAEAVNKQLREGKTCRHIQGTGNKAQWYLRAV